MRCTCLGFLIFLSFLVKAGELQIITSGGFQGVADGQGQVIIPAIYQKLGWSDGTAAITDESIGYFENGKWGLINISTRKLSGAEYNSLIPFYDDLFLAGITGKLSNRLLKGVIDNKARIHLNFKYFTIDKAATGRWIVSEYKDGQLKFGVMADDDRVVVPLEYRDVIPTGSFLVLIGAGQKKRLVDQNGALLLQPWVDQISETGYGFEVINDGLHGLLSENGSLIYDLTFKSFTEKGVPVRFPLWEVFTSRLDSLEAYNCDSITLDTEAQVLIAHVNNAEHLLPASDVILKDRQQSLKYVGDGFLVTKNINTQAWSIYKTDGREIATGFDSVAVDSAYFYTLKRSEWSVYNFFGRKISEDPIERLGKSHARNIPVKKGKYWGWVDFQADMLIDYKYDLVSPAIGSSQFMAKNFGKWGVKNFHDDWLIMPNYDTLYYNDRYYFAQKGAATHVYSKDARLLRELPYQVQMHETYALLEDEGYHGIITDAGFVASPHYTAVRECSGYYELVGRVYASLIAANGKQSIGEAEKIQRVISYSENYFHIIKDGKHGFVDVNGKLRIANRYDDAQPFQEGLAPVKLMNRWGFVDPYENLIIQPFYEEVSVFQNNLAVISSGGQYGIIDKAGKEVVVPKWKMIKRLPTGNYLVTDQTGKSGLVSGDGRFLLRPNYERLQDTEFGFVVAVKGGLSGVVDYEGITKVPFDYDEIQVKGEYLLLKKN